MTLPALRLFLRLYFGDGGSKDPVGHLGHESVVVGFKHRDRNRRRRRRQSVTRLCVHRANWTDGFAKRDDHPDGELLPEGLTEVLTPLVLIARIGVREL